MNESLLNIENLTVKGGDREILHGLNLRLKKGEVHVILGPNGSGKSTLMNVIMGHPDYEVTAGSIFFDGEDILPLKTFERARRGLFLSFQSPEEIPGVTVENMLRTAKSALTGQKIRLVPFRRELENLMKELAIDPAYAKRDLNVGFSGGEKKKSEILQLLTLNPKLALLDETDSGLDVDAVQIVSKGVAKFQQSGNAVLIITHNAKILEGLTVDKVHILMDGRIVEEGDASLIDKIESTGFGVVAAKD